MTTSALEALQPPVLLRAQHLAHQRQVVLLDHAHDQDRQVAGDAVRPEARLAERVARQELGRRAQRGVGPQHVRGELLVELRLVGRDAEVAQAHLGLGRGEREGAGGRGGVVVLLGERDRRGSRLVATPVANARRTCPPGAMRTRRRRLRTGSSTAPVVPESARPSSATGSSGVRPRPRKRARSVSHSIAPWTPPSALSTCTAQRVGSSGERGRRPHSSAEHSGRYSVSRNSFRNAGWARSSAGGASTTSTRLVTSISRRWSLRLISETRRTSTSSSGDTVISSRVSMPSSVRSNTASSARKLTW